MVPVGLVSQGYLAAQNPLSAKESKEVVDAITEPWNDWETLTISGKLKMPGLPLNPSVKIFMDKDSLIRISLRAPLMGEVGRAEIEGDSILVVNKMKKTYVKEPISTFMSRYPVTLGDLQSLLLGRIVIPGGGTLTSELEQVIELYPEADEEYSLIPCADFELEEFSYGYLINADLQPYVLLVIPADKPEINVNVTYEYYDKGYNIVASYVSPDKIYGGTLELDYPTEGGSPIEPIKLNNKFVKLTPEQFMKSF